VELEGARAAGGASVASCARHWLTGRRWHRASETSPLTKSRVGGGGDMSGRAGKVPSWHEARHLEMTERLGNLALVLAEEEEDGGGEVPEIPDEAPETWTEEEIREYYRSRGARKPTRETTRGGLEQQRPSTSSECGLAGGTRSENEGKRQEERNLDVKNTGPEAYRSAAIESGIAFRPHGLFPPGDALLSKLCGESHLRPFEKHLLDEEERVVAARQSWAAGNSACASGLDLRCFIDLQSLTAGGSDGDTTVGSRLSAAVRFGDAASIGNGFSAHGGAIETSLDEATAELAKMTQGVMCFTTEANFKLKQKVELHKTYLIEATVTKLGIRGMRVFIEAELKDPDSGQVAALCSVQMANMAKVMAKRK